MQLVLIIVHAVILLATTIAHDLIEPEGLEGIPKWFYYGMDYLIVASLTITSIWNYLSNKPFKMVIEESLWNVTDESFAEYILPAKKHKKGKRPSVSLYQGDDCNLTSYAVRPEYTKKGDITLKISLPAETLTCVITN